MEFMDLLFTEYADPFSLLDNVIPLGQFTKFLETFSRKHEERIRWEFYIHKLSALDERTWEEFNNDLDSVSITEKPSKEEITDIVKNSYSMLNSFDPEGRG